MGTVHSVTINQPTIRRTWDGRFLGHEFEVIIDVTNASECQLRWYEKTNLPYYDTLYQTIGNIRVKTRLGMLGEKYWNNMYKLIPDSDIFTPWRNAPQMGRVQIKIVDIPATEVPSQGGKERRLDFRIIVEGSDGTERAVLASQEVKALDGEPTKNFFVVLANNVQTESGGFNGGEAPTYHPMPS